MAASKRILIVDDETPIVTLLAQTFEQEGHKIEQASDGIDCMNKMAAFSPDVVIMDIMMPKLDGVDTTRLIRRNPNYSDTLIVALSARSDDETRERMKVAGANVFVRKPFVIAKLLDRVSSLLAARSASR